MLDQVLDRETDISTSDVTLDDLQEDLIVLDTIDLQDEAPFLDLVKTINRLVAKNSGMHEATVTILGDEHWQAVLQSIVPTKLLNRGLGKHFNILIDPRNRRHVLVGPGAVGNIAEKNKTGYSEVVYTLLNATGAASNEVLERGCADLLAQAISKKMKVNFYAKNYPGEADFVLDLIKSFKPEGDPLLPWVLLVKNDPEKFFTELKKSKFYRWWENFAKKKDALSQFTRLFDSLSSSNGQLEGSFLQWAQVCTKRYVQYREATKGGEKK